jgi:hypothetical protein
MNNILKKISMLLGILMITLLSLTINVQAQAVNYRIYNGLDYTYTSWGGTETQGTFGGTSRAGSYGSLNGNGGNTSDGSYVSSNGQNYNATYRAIDTGRIISKSQIGRIDFLPYTGNYNTRLYVADNDGVFKDTGLVVNTNGATVSIAGSSLPVANVRYMKGVSSSLTDGIQIVIHLADMTPPTKPTVSLSRSGWGANNVTFSITPGTDSETGVNRTEWAVDNAGGGTAIGWTTYTGSVNLGSYALGNGGHWIYARTIDNSGNVSSVNFGGGYSDTCTGWFGIDTVAPTLSLTPNTTAQTNSNVTITATASDGTSGLWGIQTPDGNWTNASSVNYTVSSNGTYTFYAKDNTGNISSQTINVSNINMYNATLSCSDMPSYMEAGQQYTVHITATNTGNQTWNGNYRLGAVGESDPLASTRQYLPTGTNIATGSSYVFPVTMTAPATTGTYTTDWRMVNEGVTWFGGSVSYNVNVVKTNPSTLTLTPNPSGNYIDLNWTAPTSTPTSSQSYSYMLYSKGVNDTSFQTIPAKSSIKVLNVYPNLGNNLKTWMETNGYGKGLISVDEVNIDTFNSNPSNYLGTSGNWKYDVVNFGSWDSNNGKDLNATSEALVETFIKSGRGVLFGHDTISKTYMTNFCKLAPYVNMTLSDIPYEVSSSIRVAKKGLLTNYPWVIGDIGTNLTIPSAHSYGQTPHGDVWMSFNNSLNDFYLTTWNNTAMIQTGHSSGQATVDEQKLIANTLFYLGQVTTDTSWSDRKGQDVNAPNSTSVTSASYNNANNTFTVNYNGATDNGSTYQYYIESTASVTNAKIQSATKTATITTGIKGYAIVVDQNPTATLSNNVISTTTSYTFNKPYSGNFYVHIASVDNAGNMSATTTYLVDNTAPTLTITPSTTAWTNGTIVLNVTASDSDTGVKNIQKPDGSISTGNTTTYTVNANGTYNFVVTDNVGNQTTKSITITNIDTTAPTLSLSPSTATWTNGSVVITATTSDDSSGISSIVLPNGNTVSGTSTTYTVSSNGNYTFKTTDNSGNTIQKSIYVDSIKTSTPDLSISPSTTAWTNQSVNLTSIFSDSLNTVNTIKTPDGITSRVHNKSPKILDLDYSGTASVNANIGNRLKAWGYDVTFDNTVTSLSQLSGYDLIIADQWYWSVTKGSLLNQAYTAGYRIISQGNDTQNTIEPITSVTYNNKTFDNQRTVVNEVTTSLTSPTNVGDTDNGYIITGIADDAVAWSTCINYPGSAGIVYAHNPVGGKWVHIQPSMTGSQFDEFFMSSVDELSSGSKFAPTQLTKNYSVSTNGTYSFTATDFAGNTNTKSITVSNIDTTAPILSLAQNPTSWTSSSVTITATGSDSASGVASITLPNGAVVNGSTSNYTVSSNGTYTFLVKDVAGNVTTKSIIVSNIDITPPTLNLALSSTNWTNGTATINVTTSDVGSGVKSITLPNGTIVSGNTATYTVTDIGVYYFTVVDNVGNSTTAYIVVGNIDKNKPNVSISNNGNWTNASGVDVNISATDN